MEGAGSPEIFYKTHHLLKNHRKIRQNKHFHPPKKGDFLVMIHPKD